MPQLQAGRVTGIVQIRGEIFLGVSGCMGYGQDGLAIDFVYTGGGALIIGGGAGICIVYVA